MRLQLPFGLAQIGRAFRNELSPGNFLFRLREFEQMELEYFCAPSQSDQEYQRWVQRVEHFLLHLVKLSPERVRRREHQGAEKAHYARATTDIEYRYSFGWKELWGIAHRSDFDLSQHAQHSRCDLMYRDPHSKEAYFPHVVEPSVGLDRLVYAVLSDAYHPNFQGSDRAVLALSPLLAPYLFAVMPLVTNSPELLQKTLQLKQTLASVARGRAITSDSSGTVGRRYRRQDQIGTPFCAVVDFQTLQDDTFTIRFRDSMEQIRLPFQPSAIQDFLSSQLPSPYPDLIDFNKN